jgi:hypothetical protein
MALFEPIFKALDEAGIRYVTVGGVAVVLHGHARLTADLDLAVDLAPGPAAAAVKALEQLGLRPRMPVDAGEFADAEVRKGWIKEKGMEVFTMWDPGDPTVAVDLFVAEPIDFEELWERSEVVKLEGSEARIASIPDLIRMKSGTGRSLDEDDVAALEAILESREDGS